MTREETAQIVKKLHDIYIQQDRYVTADSIKARINYWEIYFKDFTFAVVSKVVDQWIRHNHDMPVPSDLLQACKDERDMEYARATNIQDPENFRPPWELEYEARNGKIEIKPEIAMMTDKIMDWLRTDPKLKAKYKAEQEEKAKNCGYLPYEI